MQIHVAVADWFTIDEPRLLDQIFALGRGSLPLEDLTIRLTIPMYDAIKHTIEAGLPHQPHDVCAAQQQQLESAARCVGDLQLASAYFLRECMRYVGGRAAVAGCAQLLRLGAGQIVARLATYQVDDDSMPPRRNPTWYDIRNRNFSVCQAVHQDETLARVRIDHRTDRRTWFAWIPVHRLPPYGSFESTDFDADTWLTQVLPQCVLAHTLDGGDEVEWLPSDDLTYVAESLRYSEDPRNPLYESHVDVRTARLCVNAITDPPMLRFGPLGLFPPGSSPTFLLSRTRACHAEVVHTGGREWRAPSAWHAALFLRDLASWNRMGRPSHPRFTTAFSDAPGGAFLFRGQRNADWSLKSALARVESETERDNCAAALAQLMLAITHLSTDAEMPMIDAAGVIGAAQHYGLPTWFLDFSVDPLVAAFFASDGGVPGEHAAIYWLPIEGAMQHGGRLVLAPFWVERLYAQLGCFVGVLDDVPGTLQRLVAAQFQGPEPDQLAAACYRLVFPASHDLAQSEYGNVDRRIYPEGVWMKKAIAWALERKMPTLDPVTLASELVATAGRAPFVGGSINPQNHFRMTDFIGRMVEWIALTIRGDDGDARSFVVNDGAMRRLFAQNPLVYEQLCFAAELARKYVGTPEKQVAVSANVGTKAMLIWLDQHIDAERRRLI